MGTAIGDIRWTYLSAVLLRYRQVNRPWKHILLKVITDWCYSSADWHLNLCKTAVQLTRLPKGHLFTANTAEQKHLIAFELSISKYGERSNSFSLMVLFFFKSLHPCYHSSSLLDSDVFIKPTPFFVSSESHSLSSVPSLLRVTCSSFSVSAAASATVLQYVSMLMRWQHMAHSLFKLSRQTGTKPLNSPCISSPYLPQLDHTTLIS